MFGAQCILPYIVNYLFMHKHQNQKPWLKLSWTHQEHCCYSKTSVWLTDDGYSWNNWLWFLFWFYRWQIHFAYKEDCISYAVFSHSSKIYAWILNWNIVFWWLFLLCFVFFVASLLMLNTEWKSGFGTPTIHDYCRTLVCVHSWKTWHLWYFNML